MRALIRKAFLHGGREMIVGAVEEIHESAFDRLKSERLITHAPEIVTGAAAAPKIGSAAQVATKTKTKGQ